MARKPRIHFPGALYHVIFRGNAGQQVFSTVMGWLAVQSGAATLTDVGGWFGRDVATMSAAVRRLAERAERCEELREVMLRLQAALTNKVTGSCC